ncbi:hypothetical protein FLJC2902T_16200 [Flavobacterium limnosediminis JC2902]|uniref:Uncharacterized protein n=1 Tax=Flavobacterium limnosediminis JC2902 TaxID=1341181 RepID=V6SPY0_9FLAO|nr:hypothetical protein FLJC2902T_16200 [Flavobacterium limnosediminis JC2902]
MFPFYAIFLYLTGFKNLSGIKDAAPTDSYRDGARGKTITSL